MSKKEPADLDNLIDEALWNAREDRVRTMEAYDKTKDALSAEDDEHVRTTMFIGDKAVDLLDQLSRSNEQIVKLAQIIERREGREKKNKEKPFNLDDLKDSFDDLDNKRNDD